MDISATKEKNRMNVEQYKSDFQDVLTKTMADEVNVQGLEASVDAVRDIQSNNKKIILIGNGGSAAIAEHMAIDFTKNAQVKATTLSGTPQLTTLANDCGYENVYKKSIEAFGDEGDLLIAISSSGMSANILNGVEAAQQKGCKVITLSGFQENNALRTKGDINLYVPSMAYGYVEIIHNFLIHYINDKIIGKTEYKA